MARALMLAMLMAFSLAFAAPAGAADGQIVITQAKALAGNVTPGDAKGFPVSITRSGSYILGTNLNVAMGKIGIDVTATEVSIDLNGFRIDGAGKASRGIVGRQRSLTVRNGTIRAFKLDGIYTLGALMIVEDMRIAENGGRGIYDLSDGWVRILTNTIFGNVYEGVACSRYCHVEGNLISNNGSSQGVSAAGLIFYSSGMALGNMITGNGHFGTRAGGAVGMGNNTIVHNIGGQIYGGFIQLHPNACSPQAC